MSGVGGIVETGHLSCQAVSTITPTFKLMQQMQNLVLLVGIILSVLKIAHQSASKRNCWNGRSIVGRFVFVVPKRLLRADRYQLADKSCADGLSPSLLEEQYGPNDLDNARVLESARHLAKVLVHGLLDIN